MRLRKTAEWFLLLIRNVMNIGSRQVEVLGTEISDERVIAAMVRDHGDTFRPVWKNYFLIT